MDRQSGAEQNRQKIKAKSFLGSQNTAKYGMPHWQYCQTHKGSFDQSEVVKLVWSGRGTVAPWDEAQIRKTSLVSARKVKSANLQLSVATCFACRQLRINVAACETNVSLSQEFATIWTNVLFKIV